MTPYSFLSALRSNPFIGILRGVEASQLTHVLQVAKQANLDFVEITMNTTGASELIHTLARLSHQDEIEIGAGTVRSLEDLEMALEAGATYIVCPHTDVRIIEACARKGVPCLPGALTPTEVQNAFAAGATCVKVFPVKALGGASYIKELRGPFQDIPLLACGGVDTHNVAEYFTSGVDAVAFGASIFRKDWMSGGEWVKIASAISKLRESSGKLLS